MLYLYEDTGQKRTCNVHMIVKNILEITNQIEQITSTNGDIDELITNIVVETNVQMNY